MEINKVILERVGIILNFIAGFLIAPELVGSERLRKWEIKIENTLYGFNYQISSSALIKPILFFFSLLPDKFIRIYSYLLLLSSFYVIPIYAKVMINVIVVSPYFLWFIHPNSYKNQHLPFTIINYIGTIILVWVSIYILTDKAYIYPLPPKQGIKSLLSIIGVIILICLYYPVILISIFMSIMTLFVLWICLKGVEALIKLFEGNEKLKSLMVLSGITIYILGNLLQLLAT